MNLESAVSGDVNDLRVIGLGQPLSPTDLVGATVEGHVWLEGSTTVHVLVGAVYDAARRLISVNLGAAGGWLPSAAAGEYLIEYQVTMLDGRVWTWPSAAPDRITVREGK